MLLYLKRCHFGSRSFSACTMLVGWQDRRGSNISR